MSKTHNKLSDLNNHLFEELERLNDESLTGDALQEERERAKSMANIAQTIINNGELALKAVKHFDEYGKEKVPDIQLIAVEQSLLDEAITEVERNVPGIVALKNGEVNPIRCEHCDYCKHTRILKAPIWSSELIGEV